MMNYYVLFFWEHAQDVYLFLCLQARVKVEDKADKAKLMLQKKSIELEVALSTVAKEKKRNNKLQGDMDEVLAAMDELNKKAEELCHIRHTESRGNPMKVQT
jgi:hypothetical protein